MYDLKNLSKFPRLAELAPEAFNAFVAFDEPIITYYWIHTDDWQGSDWGSGACGGRFGRIGDCFERRAVIDKVGVSYR